VRKDEATQVKVFEVRGFIQSAVSQVQLRKITVACQNLDLSVCEPMLWEFAGHGHSLTVVVRTLWFKIFP
jgi:hypothetical protein